MSTEPSPGARLAAELRRSPIYVDPSLASALPEPERKRLIAKFGRLGVPVFVVLVPLVKGGTWSDDDQLVTVVHANLGRDGVYITFGGIGDDLRAKEFGGDHQAREAAWAVSFDRAYRDAPVTSRLDRIADLMLSGTAKKEYDRQSAAIDKRAKERETRGPHAADGDGSAVVPVVLGAAGIAAAGVGGLLLWRRRRMASVRREGSALLLPRTVFATAKRAGEDQLREQASREVVVFGELLDGTDVPASGERAGELMARALDAYQAAGKTLDGARGIPDLAGVLVLLDQGRDALASARAVASGGPEIPPSPLCFFNPLHGDAATEVDWRPIGSRRRLHVHACRDCARAARAKETPDILMDRRDGRDVPYFEVDPTESVWAETGYGQLRDDLIPRILRGDLNPR
ncbi:Uncharacterised protein [Mycobacterium tuberculosis]|nr:Uncharacterised protein [Mycobacterium tuberculosis]